MSDTEEFMFGRLGPWEIGIIVLIILIVFGVGKLPQVGGAIGKGLRTFRKESSGQPTEEKPPKTTKRTARASRKQSG